jgi:hypothetical protein
LTRPWARIGRGECQIDEILGKFAHRLAQSRTDLDQAVVELLRDLQVKLLRKLGGVQSPDAVGHGADADEIYSDSA